MNPQNLIISGLNPRFFWDVDLSALKYASATRLIIERIFFLGDMKEMNQVINFYGEQKVIEALCNLAYIDPKTLNFISKLFNIPHKEFKCYQRKQSMPQLWSS